MHSGHEHFACDQSIATPKLRTDLQIDVVHDPDAPHVVIGDPLSGSFFRLGKREFAFASRLDGTRTIRQAYTDLCGCSPDVSLNENDAIELCRWLVANELASTDASRSPERMISHPERASLGRQIMGNPLAIRLPLARPDRRVASLSERLGWFFSPVATALGIFLILVAGFFAVRDFPQLAAATRQSFGPQMLIAVVTVAVILKVIHEFSHAIVCKRYGVPVGEMGISLILFLPLAYVDVNSAWTLRSRWRRAHIAAAGMYTELIVASIAMLLWQWSDQPTLRYLCLQVMLTAGVATLAFNANPLMKFDGYYILSDLADHPSLYSDAQTHFTNRLRCLFFGDQVPAPNWNRRYRFFVSLYGPLASAWKFGVCVTLLITASELFAGLGALLALLAGVTWFGSPLKHLADQLRKSEPPRRRRFMLTSCGLFLALAGVSLAIPSPTAGTAAGIVEYAPHVVVRAQVSGFVDAIEVSSGQFVQRGDVLVRLSNPELTVRLRELELERETATLRMRQQTHSAKHHVAQAESIKLKAIEKDFAETAELISHLTIQAPNSGVVTRRGLQELQGTYVRPGDDLMVIGNEDQKELRLWIEQSKFDAFEHQLGNPIRFRSGINREHSGTLIKVAPRATTAMEHAALAATNGGPLPVTLPSNETASQRGMQLLSPHFEATVALSGSVSRDLKSGQRLCATLGDSPVSLGGMLWQRCLSMRRWLPW